LPIYGLEDLGIVPRGEAGAFIVERNTAAGGKRPLNTNGDGLSYMHSGMHAAGERASDARHRPAQTPTSATASAYVRRLGHQSCRTHQGLLAWNCRMGRRPRKMWLGGIAHFAPREEVILLGHISFGVSDLARTTAFYDATMMALGYARVFTGPGSVGYGLPGTENDRLRLFLTPDPVTPPGPGFHLAFLAPNRDTVDRFHEAALKFGGVDQGTPGLRPHYGPGYYAAFVLDPDGYKLEAKHPPPER